MSDPSNEPPCSGALQNRVPFPPHLVHAAVPPSPGHLVITPRNSFTTGELALVGESDIATPVQSASPSLAVHIRMGEGEEEEEEDQQAVAGQSEQSLVGIVQVQVGLEPMGVICETPVESASQFQAVMSGECSINLILEDVGAKQPPELQDKKDGGGIQEESNTAAGAEESADPGSRSRVEWLCISWPLCCSDPTVVDTWVPCQNHTECVRAVLHHRACPCHRLCALPRH